VAGGARGAVLVTGGAGYIGSHVLKAVRDQGRAAVAFDNLSLGFREAVLGAPLIVADIRDQAAVAQALREHQVEAVVHLAGLIEVGRSVKEPDLFWDHNLAGTLSLLRAMRDCGVGRLVFSSSAAVYGHSADSRWSDLLVEDSPKAPASPYGDTKLACERLIAAHCVAYGLSAVALRYFNAAGADVSGLLGEAHHPETHLIPLALQAALGQRGPLTVFGADFPTPDGSCLRDYVHVADLAEAHLAALEADLPPGAFEAVNIGSGQGHSVLEVIAAIERTTGLVVPHAIGGRRAGDPPSLVADPGLANRRYDWAAKRSNLDSIVADAARWHRDQKYGRR
jgi:UDP-glucose-4-epimerase GalE